uniref:Uncharacterized protein n=1 Tax=Cacopsylla melanoneura TaxID=428564 RepID=A0A8D8PWD3_9HEMI
MPRLGATSAQRYLRQGANHIYNHLPTSAQLYIAEIVGQRAVLAGGEALGQRRADPNYPPTLGQPSPNGAFPTWAQRWPTNLQRRPNVILPLALVPETFLSKNPCR